MASIARLSLASSKELAPSRKLASADRFAELFQPLEFLLCEGGDERIDLGRASRRNAYGCVPYPQMDTIAFSSSTASTISKRGFEHARRAQERMIEAASTSGLDEAFDEAMEGLRQTLGCYLDLQNTGAEILLAPSGTDAQLATCFLSQVIFEDAPTSCVVVGSDQTGSGTGFAAAGRHFNARTARGRAVLKGSRVKDHGLNLRVISVPFGTEDGRFRTPQEMDDAVLATVEAEVRGGRRVVLQTMDASKFGWRAPSAACVSSIEATWPHLVQVVVDACQMRSSPSRIRRYLAREQIVIVTGSKFFTGPPFSGAILLPQKPAHLIRAHRRLPTPLMDYLTRLDFPQSWSELRRDFETDPNFGLWLRWVAALEEMRNYYSLDMNFRKRVLVGIAAAVSIAMTSCSGVEPVMPFSNTIEADDEEFATPTIFPFLVRDKHGYLTSAQVSEFHHALNRDIAGDVALTGEPTAGQLCQIGQPVNVHVPGNRQTAALRIAIGSRTLFEAWSPGPGAEARAVQKVASDIGAVLGKIALLLDHPAIWTASGEEPRGGASRVG